MNLFGKISEYLGHKPKSFILAINAALLLCTGLADYLTGYEIGISLFYLIPISLAAWFGGRTLGLLFSLMSALITAAVDFMAGEEYSNIVIEGWNLLMRFGFFSIYTVVLSTVKIDLDERRKLVEELQQALSEVKRLSGLLPTCASCKKIRDDKGFWNRMEDYISDHSEAEFSHGICPECAQRLYPKEYAFLLSKQGDKTDKV
ncbi:MAG: DUF4118 domain-containing protein [Nitrospirae bacterium]|nr:DUF4118 domain-containing protein [Nitrospirota bacterium]